MASKRQFWLVKSEPDCFSIHDLAKCPNKTTAWSGVRNYQARNFMRAMQLGDGVLFYHSSADPPAVAGTATVAREAYADHTALDPKDDHYDPKASRDNPIWDMVDIRLEKVFAREVPIGELRARRELAAMELLRQGSRLSVQPVRESEFKAIVALAGQSPAKNSFAKKSSAKGPTAKKAKQKTSRAR
jgi:predicted RNA-binding protein with PUA-like domain